MNFKKFSITIKTKSKINLVKELSPNEILLHIKETPVDGKANKAIIKLLSRHFKVPQKNIEILTGLKYKKKIISILFPH